jgi:two-component system, NarL family, nitrate/nitrite response regulator NarL
MKVLLAMESGLFADAFGLWLRSLLPDIELLRRNPDSVRTLREKHGPRLTVIDIDSTPNRHARALVADFRRTMPNTCVVVIGSATGDTFIKGLIKAGVDAYLPKSYGGAKTRAVLETVLKVKLHDPGAMRATPDRLESNASHSAGKIRTRPRGVSKSPYGLTGRELDVLELACFGLSNRHIADRLGISIGVVKIHLHHAYEKLGVEGRVQAIRIVENLDEIQALQSERTDSAAALLNCLLSHMTHERHRKGSQLFSKGEPGNAMYYIQQGQVRLPELGVNMQAGEILGELGVFAPMHIRTSSARCEEDTALFKLTAEQAKRLCLENPRFAYYMIRLISDRLVRERTVAE